MTAEEARTTTDIALSKGQAIAPLIKRVGTKINHAALAGQYFITHPLRGFTGTYPSTEVARQLWLAI